MHGENTGTGSMRKRIAVNTGSQIAARFVTSGTTFLVSILTARTLGTEGFGTFTKITTFVALFYLLTDFGFNALFLKQSGTGDGTDTFSDLLTLRSLITAALLVCLGVLTFLLPGSITGGYTNAVKIGILLYAPTIIFQSVITSANAVFQKTFRYGLATRATVIGSLVTIMGMFLLLKSETRSFLYPLLLVQEAGLLGIAAVSYFYSSRFIQYRFSRRFHGVRMLFLASLPFGLTLMCNVLYFRADHIIMTLYRTTSEVGIYGLAYKMFEFPLAVPTFFMNAVYPILVRFSLHPDQPSARTFIGKTALTLTGLSAITTLGMWSLAPYISFIRSGFAASVIPLRILCLGLPAFFLSSLTMWIFVAYGKTRLLLGLYCLSMIMTVIMDLLFIPAYGMLAAAWITVISETALALISLLFVSYYFRRHEI